MINNDKDDFVEDRRSEIIDLRLRRDDELNNKALPASVLCKYNLPENTHNKFKIGFYVAFPNYTYSFYTDFYTTIPRNNNYNQSFLVLKNKV